MGRFASGADLISDNPIDAPYERSAHEFTIIGRARWFAKGDLRRPPSPHAITLAVGHWAALVTPSIASDRPRFIT